MCKMTTNVSKEINQQADISLTCLLSTTRRRGVKSFQGMHRSRIVVWSVLCVSSEDGPMYVNRTFHYRCKKLGEELKSHSN